MFLGDGNAFSKLLGILYRFRLAFSAGVDVIRQWAGCGLSGAQVAVRRTFHPDCRGSIDFMSNCLPTFRAFAARRFALRTALMVFGSLTGLFVGGGVVRGETCGHYLFRNGQPVGHSLTTDAEATAAAFASRHAERTPLLPRVPRLPCSGPGCQKQSVPMMPAPVFPSATPERDPAAILDALLSPAEIWRGSCVPQSEFGEVRLPTPIFRPPAA